jgi:hypothetical protein
MKAFRTIAAAAAITGITLAGGMTYAENDHTSATTLGAWNSAAAERMKIGAFRDLTKNFYDGCLDDLAVWKTRLSSNEVALLYQAGTELGYNAQDVEILKAIYAGGPGTSDQTSDGETWVYTTGLPPLASWIGRVTNDGGAIVMDASGNGVRKVGGALLSLLRFDGTAENAVQGAPGGVAKNCRPRHVQVATYVTGKIGRAIKLVGASQQYVDMVDGARPNAVDGGIWSGSMGVWLKTREYQHDPIWSAMAEDESYLSMDPNCADGVQENSLRFYLRMYGGASKTVLLGVTDPANGRWRDGDWHHLLWTWHATKGPAGTGALALYLDGEPVGVRVLENTHTTASLISNWSTAVNRRPKIGSSREFQRKFFDGTLDEFAAWGVELTAVEAKALYALGNELGYDAMDSQVVLDTFAQGPDAVGRDSRGCVWQYRSGLSGTPGELNGLTMVLDTDGNGVVGQTRDEGDRQ